MDFVLPETPRSRIRARRERVGRGVVKISGIGWGGTFSRIVFGKRRKHVPARTRPARPARWSREEREEGEVTSADNPLLVRIWVRDLALSITRVMLGTVILASAIEVARIILVVRWLGLGS